MSYLAYSFFDWAVLVGNRQETKKIVPKEMGTMSVTELILVSKE